MTSFSKSTNINIPTYLFVEVQYSNKYVMSAESCLKHSLFQLIHGSNANWSSTSLLNYCIRIPCYYKAEVWYTDFLVSKYKRGKRAHVDT